MNWRREKKKFCQRTGADVDGDVELAVVFGMVVVDHLEEVVVVTRAEGLVQGTIERLAGEGSHGYCWLLSMRCWCYWSVFGGVW